MKKSENSLPSDYLDIKQVDRDLSYPFIQDTFIICDVGGAAGIDAHKIAKLAYFTVDLDVNASALEVGKRQADNIGISHSLGFIMASATNLPFRNIGFDMVTCFSVLDHIPGKDNAQKSIMEFSRVIKKNGFVSITVPNSEFLFGTIIMMLKQFMDEDAFFEQRFSPKELYGMIKKAGLTPTIYGSRFPTIISNHILIHNFPKQFQKIPYELIDPVFKISEKIFFLLQFVSLFKFFGARIGYLSIK